MKKIMLIALFPLVAFAQEPQVSGNNNVVQICQPKIEVKTCGGDSCCAKPKVIYKTKVVEKVVEKEVERIVKVPIILEKDVVVEKTVEKKIIKKHILSLFIHRAVTGGSDSTSSNPPTSSANAKVTTSLVPGVMYQYQFDNGFVPMIGLDVTGQPIGAVGIEF